MLDIFDALVIVDKRKEDFHVAVYDAIENFLSLALETDDRDRRIHYLIKAYSLVPPVDTTLRSMLLELILQERGGE